MDLIWRDGSHPGPLPRKDLREPQGALQIPPLRYATVGMTRGEGWLRLLGLRDSKKPQVPPLRCAPVGMTILLRGQLQFRSILPASKELSSRPERSAVEGPAVSPAVIGLSSSSKNLIWTRLAESSPGR
jgi:hypothetical protein